MNNPIISVIVPAYNASTYIEKCVNSILSSTIKAIEVIVVDDKSHGTVLLDSFCEWKKSTRTVPGDF